MRAFGGRLQSSQSSNRPVNQNDTPPKHRLQGIRKGLELSGDRAPRHDPKHSLTPLRSAFAIEETNGRQVTSRGQRVSTGPDAQLFA